jgi:hypothetical protein
MKNFAILVIVVSIGFLGCNSGNGKSSDIAEFQNTWNRLFRTAKKNETYSLLTEHQFYAGENVPPNISDFRVHRKGKKFAVLNVGKQQDQVTALIFNERYACWLTESRTSGKWMASNYIDAGSDEYNRLATAANDYLQMATSADQILSFWNSTSNVECDLGTSGNQAELELAFEYPTSGREYLTRYQLRKDLAPKKGTVRFDIDKMQRKEAGWILSWDMTWSRLINGEEYIQHKRVEASDWKRFDFLDCEIPTVLNSFTNESGEELWYMRRTVVDVQALTSDDAKLFYMSGFGLPELHGNNNWFWASILISLFSAAALFFVFRRLKAR